MQGHEGELGRRQACASAALFHALSNGAQHVVTEGFDVFFWSIPDPFFRSVALPKDSDAEDPSAIRNMVSIFVRAGRQPRLEFFDEAWPWLTSSMAKSGFCVEVSMPAMSLSKPPTDCAGKPAKFLTAQDNTALYHQFLAGMSKAFGYDDGVHPDEIECLRRNVAQGQAIVAVTVEGHEIVAGAAVTVCLDIGELQGVWVRQDKRGTGIGANLCAALLQNYWRRYKSMVWLCANEQSSARLYKKLGFKRMGTRTNMVLEPSSPRSSVDRDMNEQA